MSTELEGPAAQAPSDPSRETPARSDSPRFRFFLAQGIVIVASVLVALAADRIVMGLDERALESSYLEGLLEDIEAIEALAEDASARAASRDTEGIAVLDALRNREDADASGMALAKALVRAGWMIEPRFPRVTWDDLLRTGRLGLIDDTGLREAVAGFYGEMEQMETFARGWVEATSEYGDILRELMTPELRVAIGNEVIYCESKPDPCGDAAPDSLAPDPRLLIERMRGAPRLQATLGDVLLINKVAAIEYGDLAERARGVQALITAELGGS